MEKVQIMMAKFEHDLSKYPILVKAEEKTKCPKHYMVLCIGSLLLICLLTGFGAGLICNLGGYVYPAFCSFKAIESISPTDDSQWLTYWVVFAAFSILEAFVSIFINWIPFYYALKLAFLAWCFLPQTQGAAFLYNNFMKDFLAEVPSKDKSKIPSALKDKIPSALKGDEAAYHFKGS